MAASSRSTCSRSPGARLVPAQIAAVMSAFGQTLVDPSDELHDEGDEDLPGVSWNGYIDRWHEDH